MNEAYRTIQLKRKEDEANWERHEKAEWAIYLCNRRVITFIVVFIKNSGMISKLIRNRLLDENT